MFLREVITNFTQKVDTLAVKMLVLLRLYFKELFHALHQYCYGTFLGLIDGQTVTPTFLIFPFGQFCTGVDEIIDILSWVIGIDQVLLQVESVIR